MTRQVGFTISGDKITLIDAEVPDDPAQPITVLADTTWRLQIGDRGPALHILHQQCADYIREHNIQKVIIKGSAAVQGRSSLALLLSAEVRGVVIAAAGSVCTVSTLAKNVISRTYGDRKVDDYIKDDAFWQKEVVGIKRVGSREAAMLLVANRNK